jgi:uncharacterized protein (TIGR02646 family)
VSYLATAGAGANWADFRDHNSSKSYNELMNALSERQHQLCCYCEIDLHGSDRQIEHFIPQSDPIDGAVKATDWTNLLACCKGGTNSLFGPGRAEDQMRYRRPVPENQSCGQAKGNRPASDFVDPRLLAALPSVTRVLDDGKLESDDQACINAGLSEQDVTVTIDRLGLNGPRLRNARANHWDALRVSWGEETDPVVLAAAVRQELLPDENGVLVRFFTPIGRSSEHWAKESSRCRRRPGFNRV